MITLIYPYRDRDLARVVKSLNSLQKQTVSTFEVYFVDYGSKPEIAKSIKNICSHYTFVNYKYYYTQFQPWNKSKALNIVIKTLQTNFCVVADVDMIFHPSFVETVINLQKPLRSVYFQVGFLPSTAITEEISAADYNKFRKSTTDATGITMFPVEVLKKIHGFDEFYHFWGAEDSDVHVRLRNAGYEIEYFDQKVLMLHQWHKSYRLSEKKKLTSNYQVKGIVQVNHRHFSLAKEHNRTKVNQDQWGNIMTEEEFQDLEKIEVQNEILNRKSDVDAFLFCLLPTLKDQFVKVRFKNDPFQQTKKYKLKKLLSKKIPEYYSLKEINDRLLLHLISFYRNKAYNYKIEKDLKGLCLTIKL